MFKLRMMYIAKHEIARRWLFYDQMQQVRKAER